MPLFKTWNYTQLTESGSSSNLQLIDENGETSGIDTQKKLQFKDFRDKIGEQTFSTNPVTADQELRINFPSLGRTDGILNYNRYILGHIKGIDGNSIFLGDPMYKKPIVTGTEYNRDINTENVTMDKGSGENGSGFSYNDFVHFSIHDLETGNVIPFRAYIESFNDSYNADWSSFQYPGRGDNSYIYKSTNRKTSISWKVVALSQIDLLRVYEKLDYLASLMYPRYNSTFMKPTIHKLSVGNWFRNTPVIMESLTYDIDPETPWDIDITQTKIGAEYARELPMYVNVKADFIVLHDNIPEKGKIGQNTFLIKYNKDSNYETQIKNGGNSKSQEDIDKLINDHKKFSVSTSNSTNIDEGFTSD